MFNKYSETPVKIIEWYQKNISPDRSSFKKYFPNGYCKFTPTCSEYTKQSIIKYGVLNGIIKGMWRILRCNPFSKGGKDLP
ncbi:membrane protein insertion efficiency factor YidD [Candidatus Gracilibacteria bacterium]|nr:membrane protein insertion efficiency factor YidD [Candidatus Gracilibacteria bacterium]